MPPLFSTARSERTFPGATRKTTTSTTSTPRTFSGRLVADGQLELTVDGAGPPTASACD
jgi:hypothetical protein